jgi:hypothetical protein
MSEVQSVIFDRSLWSQAQAKAWLKKHGFIVAKIDKKKHFYRFRQMDTHYFDHYITKKLDDGVELIIGFPKPEYKGSGMIGLPMFHYPAVIYPGNIMPMFHY